MTGDDIQLSISVVLAVTLIVIAVQTYFQHKILTAQLHRDRFGLYWDTLVPITDDHVRDFNDFPEDYVTHELYEQKYRNKEDKLIRRYINMHRTYEYLAFTYIAFNPRRRQVSPKGVSTTPFTWHENFMRRIYKDPLGEDWVQKWTDELISVEEFKDAHKRLREYYPGYASFVCARIDNSISSTGAPDAGSPPTC